MRTMEFTPPGWEMEQVFRETMLASLPLEQCEKLRQGGQALYDLAIHYGDYKRTESCVVSELRAALADLRYLQGYLGWISVMPQEIECTPDENQLAQFAGQTAGQVAAIAWSIEQRLPEPPPQES